MEYKVYVVLVNYNGIKDTEECIDSLKRNTYGNYKIVVVDNCSTKDNIYELKEKWDDLLIVKNPENDGFAKANNRGIDIALDDDADYVLLLNNDTIVEADFLGSMVETAQRLSADVLTCKIKYNYDRTKVWYGGGTVDWRKGYGVHYISNELKSNTRIDFASGCCMLIRRKVCKTLKLPEDYFMYFEDVDYCVELQERGFSIFYTPYIAIYHKVSASSGAESPFFVYYWNRNRVIFLKKYQSEIGTSRYFAKLAILIATRFLKFIGYIAKGQFSKGKNMLKGIKEGLEYKIEADI